MREKREERESKRVRKKEGQCERQRDGWKQREKESG